MSDKKHGGRFVRKVAEKVRRPGSDAPDDDLWESVQLARHAERPYTLDYINRMCSEFEEMHGDRLYGDDAALVAGFGRFHDRPVAFIGQQKGRDTNERTYRNFGMAGPEGYRKAMRVMEIANRLGIPVVTLIDTPGAFPGASAEERGQGGAISRSIQMMWRLDVPTIAVVIGEGSSGGAHTDHEQSAEILDQYLYRALTDLDAIPSADRRRARRERFRKLGPLRDPESGMGMATGRETPPPG